MAKIFLLIGPSCAGKSTVQAALLERFPDLVMAKGVWTRPHRPGETDETADSRSISNRQFQRLLNEGELTAVNHVHGHWYGTDKEEFIRPLSEGKDVIRIVTDRGAEAVIADFKDHRVPALSQRISVVSMYFYVPIYVTVERLLRRGDPHEDIVRRVTTASDELDRYHAGMSDLWDYVIDASEPVDQVVTVCEGIINRERAR